MKSLTKIKLINWHGFYNETIDVEGNILITGENGSGKSTLIDGLYYVLSGGTARRFNLAAADQADRTVETYMRGYTGIQGDEALRKGSNVISHIALQYFDDVKKTTFVLGVALEIRDNANKAIARFYTLPGSEIRDDFFQTGKDVLNYVSMKAVLEEKGVTIIPFDGSGKEVRRRIGELLGVDAEKYCELLPKAMSFRPISSVNDFVYQFLLPEKNVDLTTMRENIDAYRTYKARIEDDEKRAIKLSSILHNGDEYRAAKSEKEILDVYYLAKQVENYKKYIDANKDSEATSLALLEEDKSKLAALEAQVSSLNEQIVQFQNNNGYQAFQDTQRNLNKAKEDVENMKTQVSLFNRSILDENNIARLLGIKIDFTQYIRSKDFPAFIKEMQEYRGKFQSYFDTVMLKVSRLTLKKGELDQKREELSSSRNMLDRGRHAYDYSVTTLMSVIRDGTREELGTEVQAVPFCELIDVKEGEEEWRDALEGYLATRRFDLFVPERNYDLALSLYERNKMSKRIYGVGLVNTAKIPYRDAKPGSLATKVVTDDPRAQKYVNYVLGDIICVDSEQELKHYDASITRTVMVYRNFTARQTRQEVYRTPFIGQSSLSLHSDEIAGELAAIEKEMDKVNEELANANKLRAFAGTSKAKDLSLSPNYWRLYDDAVGSVERLNRETATLRDTYNSLAINIDTYTKKRDDLLAQERDIIDDMTSIKARMQSSSSATVEAHEKLGTLQPMLDAKLVDKALASRLPGYAASHPMEAPAIAKKAESLGDRLSRLGVALSSAMQAYISEFGFDSTASLDNLDDFYKEHTLVVERDLIKYRAKADEALETCANQFQEQYIAEIRQHIADERLAIDELNKILAIRPFGNDGNVYQFTCERSLDPMFGDYFDLFKIDQDIDASSLFTAELSDKNHLLLKELFERLTGDISDSKSEKLLKQYTDYRMFMSYDIIITNKRGEKSYFSSIARGRSGGETQTPFYVTIAASFDRIANETGGSNGCLVIMDEAFNKMDRQHIQEMCRYYTELGIQFAIVVQSDRSDLIAPFVETMVGIVKVRHRTVARSFRKGPVA